MPPQVRKLMNYTFLMQSWIHLLAYYHKWVQIFIWRKNCFLQGWTQFWELSRGRLGTRYWQQRTHTTRWEIPAAGLFKCSQVRLMSLIKGLVTLYLQYQFVQIFISPSTEFMKQYLICHVIMQQFLFLNKGTCVSYRYSFLSSTSRSWQRLWRHVWKNIPISKLWY